jgi:hypothetical protein
MTSQNFASKSGSAESSKTRVRCGLISLSLQTRYTVALETPNSRAIARQVTHLQFDFKVATLPRRQVLNRDCEVP